MFARLQMQLGKGGIWQICGHLPVVEAVALQQCLSPRCAHMGLTPSAERLCVNRAFRVNKRRATAMSGCPTGWASNTALERAPQAQRARLKADPPPVSLAAETASCCARPGASKGLARLIPRRRVYLTSVNETSCAKCFLAQADANVLSY